MDHIVAGFCVVIIAGAPCAHLGCTVSHLCVYICIEKPERYIHTLDLVDVVLILEYLWKQQFSFQMLQKSRLCRIFVQLERDHEIRSEITRKLPHHYYGITAEGTGSSRHICIPDDFAAAGFTNIRSQSVRLAIIPFGSGRGIPGHIVHLLALEFGVVALECLQFEFGVAERTLHFLECAVKCNRTTATGAFILL